MTLYENDFNVEITGKGYAVFNGIQKGFKETKDFALFTIFWPGHKLNLSTVTRETLEEIGVTDIRGNK